LKAAEGSLTTEINRFISENPSLQESKSVIAGNVRKNSSQIRLKRGEMSRIFLYVNKENISASSAVIEIPVNRTENLKEKAVEAAPLPEIPETAAPDEKSVDEQPATVDKPDVPKIISDIMAANDMTALQTSLDGWKRTQQIMYGKVSTDINPAWYIVVVADGKVKAVLDKGINSRRNFVTGETDDLKNYDKYNKIWLIIYEK
jgi:hypothetical protein